MSPALLGVAWGGLVLVVAWRRRPGPPRVRELPPASCRRPLPAPARRLVPALLAAVLALPVVPVLAPVAALLAWALPVVRARRRAAAGAGVAVRRELPEVTDLLRLAVGAGMNVPLAVAAVGNRGVGPVSSELRRVAVEVAAGVRCADALDAAAGRLDPGARPLLAALAASERYGAPLAEPLERLAADARADRRRRAEEAARRVPVRLLFPLVLCILPAFALLTLAPLIAGGLSSLRLS